jgi:Reverse transcriptase (RNA-dependent DNA polymerase)
MYLVKYKKIFSQAHNRRLAPVLPKILDPTQTGFIPGRWIGYNIAEVQAAMDNDSTEGYLAVMDFEKAYDRLSHEYLCRILEAFGLGPRFQKWAQATFLNSEACLLVNGWLSAPFDILSGVRQGDPLSPSLFAMGIEGFAVLIRKEVLGIQSSFLPALRELLFADDTLAGLKDHADLVKLGTATETYEKASGSRLSLEKSFLYPLGSFRSNPPQSINGWKVKLDPFRYLGVTVGKDVDSEKEWAVIAEKAIARMRSIPMYDLPIATRCSIINIYCYSKVLYVDQFLPAPDCVIEQLTGAAQQVIWGKKKPLASRDRLCTPLDNGGFGLSDLSLQLQGPRARWIFKVLQGSAWEIRHLRQLRVTLRASLLRKEFFKQRFDSARGVLTKQVFTWNAPLCQPGDVDGDWALATHSLVQELPPRWISFLKAWNDLIELRPNIKEKWSEKILDPKWQDLNRTIPSSYFHGPKKSDISLEFFGCNSRLALLQREYPGLLPQSWQSRFDFPVARWRGWWKFLRKIRRRYPEAENSAHLLSLNSFSPGSCLAGKADSLFLNNRSKSCVLCCKAEEEETLEHLLVNCDFSRQVWSFLEPDQPQPPLSAFVCPPSVHKSLLNSISLQVVFLHRILKLSRRRRFGKLPLVALTREEAESEAKEISSHHASPVSSSFSIASHTI